MDQVGGQSQDFARFVELQQQHSEMSNKLDALEVTINRSAQAAATASATAYVVLQENLAKLDAELKSLFGQHPEWRGDKKSVGTPFGSVEQRTTTELRVDNPAMTVALIEAKAESNPTGFPVADFLHITKEPNLEMLERLSDSELGRLGISRITTERVTVKPAKVNVAKAVKAAKQPKA
jgi:hypothetical protein